jgi:hypothetical protein
MVDASRGLLLPGGVSGPRVNPKAAQVAGPQWCKVGFEQAAEVEAQSRGAIRNPSQW